MGSDSYRQRDQLPCMNLQQNSSKAAGYMHKFKLYETLSNFYMIGWNKSRTFWKVLKIDRSEPCDLNIVEDSVVYSEVECYDLLKRIHDGNKSTGGLKFVTMCYGIVGFVKFLGPYYMLLITKRKKIGMICGHAVYSIAKNDMIPIPNSTVMSNMTLSKNENRSFVNSICKCKVYLVLLNQYFVRVEIDFSSFVSCILGCLTLLVLFSLV